MSYMRRGAIAALVSLCALLSATDAMGQVAPVRVGLEGGVSLATFAGERVEGMDTKSGGFAGATVEWQVAEWAWFGTGARWTQKGATGTLVGFEEPFLTDLRLQYLQIPALVGFTLTTDARVRPVVFAGPALALELDCEVRTAPEELAITLGCPEDEGRAGHDWSLLVGAGLEIATGRGAVRFTGQYDHGLTQLNETDGSFALFHNRTFAFGAGLFLPIGF